MGSPENEEGRGGRDGAEQGSAQERQRRVTLTKFWMLETEVTVGMWRSFVKATNYQTGSGTGGGGMYGVTEDGTMLLNPKYTWENPGYPQTSRHPVVGIDWNGAVAFCEWLARETGLAGSTPDRSRVGVRLPRRNDDGVLFWKRRAVAHEIRQRLRRQNSAAGIRRRRGVGGNKALQPARRRLQVAGAGEEFPVEQLEFVRHARERCRVVLRRFRELRRATAKRPGRRGAETPRLARRRLEQIAGGLSLGDAFLRPSGEQER